MKDPSNRPSASVGMTIILVMLRIFLGSVFAFSGGLKLMAGSEQFHSVILGFHLVGGEPARFLSVYLPWAEFLGGVFLALGLWTPAALAVLWALNSVFILALGSALLRGLPMKDCGCFGDRFSMPVEATLVLDLFFWGGFWALWRMKGSSFSLDRALSK